MIKEARLVALASGLSPVSPGWFVVNARDAAWVNNDHQSHSCCIFESDDVVLRDRPDLPRYEKPGAGFVLRVIQPGRPSCTYHAESVDENFLVLLGECTLIVEDEVRQLRAWDFVHCPPETAHAFVGTGDGPCVLLCTGNRVDGSRCVSRESDVAAQYGAVGESLGGTWKLERPPGWDELPWAR
jgi:quercetin dioxygenase-like cupin family protein